MSSSQQPQGFTCFACREAKVRCNKACPCDRCVKLSLTCVPQPRGAGRPPKKKPPAPPPLEASSGQGNPATAGRGGGELVALGGGRDDLWLFSEEELAVFEGASGQSSVLSKKRTTIEVLEIEDEDEEEPTDQSSTDIVSKPKCRLLKVQRGPVSFCVTVPAHLADIMTRCLHRALTSGQVSNVKANAVLRIWSLCAFRSGEDFTGGLLPNASKILSTAGYQLRTQDGVLFLGPEEEREKEKDDDLFVGNPTFEWSKLPDQLRKLDDGGTSALSSYIYINGEFRIFCNEKFESDYMTSEECNKRMKHERAMPVFVWSRFFVDGEDKEGFLEAMIRVAFTSSGSRGCAETSEILNTMDRWGQVTPCLVRIRYVFLNHGDYAAVVLSLFALPKSRLLSGPQAGSGEKGKGKAETVHEPVMPHAEVLETEEPTRETPLLPTPSTTPSVHDPLKSLGKYSFPPSDTSTAQGPPSPSVERENPAAPTVFVSHPGPLPPTPPGVDMRLAPPPSTLTQQYTYLHQLPPQPQRPPPTQAHTSLNPPTTSRLLEQQPPLRTRTVWSTTPPAHPLSTLPPNKDFPDFGHPVSIPLQPSMPPPPPPEKFSWLPPDLPVAPMAAPEVVPSRWRFAEQGSEGRAPHAPAGVHPYGSLPGMEAMFPQVSDTESLMRKMVHVGEEPSRGGSGTGALASSYWFPPKPTEIEEGFLDPSSSSSSSSNFAPPSAPPTPFSFPNEPLHHPAMARAPAPPLVYPIPALRESEDIQGPQSRGLNTWTLR